MHHTRPLRHPSRIRGDMTPGLRATIVVIGVLLTGLVSTIVYLYTRNAQRLAERVSLQRSLELNARLFAMQFQQVLANTPSTSGTRIASRDAQSTPPPPVLATPAVLAFLTNLDGTAVSDADNIITIEVVDAETGTIWASSLRPGWAIGPTGRRPGRSLGDVAAEDEVRVGELLRNARSKGGGIIVFKYLDSALNKVFTRAAYAAPVSNTNLVVMAGTDQ